MFRRNCFLIFSVSLAFGMDLRDGRINLSNLERNVFGQPSSRTGEVVAKWNSQDKTNPEELGEYAEGDILFVSDNPGRNGLAASSTRWPGGKIPFMIDGDFDAFEMQMIEDAMNDYHDHTCIKFIPRSKEKDYIVIQSAPTGCWSAVGRTGGEQAVNLQTPACLKRKGTVIHELMHAAGFLHEQNREDRDNHVDIIWPNIALKHEHNFIKAKKGSTKDFDVPYDYGSVMHYSPKAFSVNGEKTIEPKRKNNDDELGQRVGFSKRDLEKINYMYKCR